MRFRIFLFAVTAFFVGMNVLLWRSEYLGRSRMLGSVPMDVVWERVLKSPDNSRLVIEQSGMRLGSVTLSPNVGEELATGKVMSEMPLPEGMVRQPTGYTLDLDGSLSLDANTRARLAVHLKFNTNQELWQAWVNLKIRPDSWSIRASLPDQTLAVTHEEQGRREEKVYRLASPQDLERLAADAGLPFPPGALMALGLKPGQTRISPAAFGLAWQARNDLLQFGHARIRAYRVEASLLRQYQAVVYVSQIGEILRVELPNGWVLRNDALVNLAPRDEP